MESVGKLAEHLAGEDELLVSGDHQNAGGRARGGRVGLLGAASLVEGTIEVQAEGLEPVADCGTQGRVVFTDPGSEDEGVDTTHLDQKGTDPMADRVYQHIDREARPGMALARDGGPLSSARPLRRGLG